MEGSRKAVEFTEMMNSISGRLKKPKADPRKSPKEECEGNNRKKEPEPTKHRRDEANKGEKTKDDLETTNSDESENRSEKADSVQMFDSETLNQLKAKRKKRQQKRRQHYDSKGAEKGCTSRQANRKGRGARARREARRNRSDDPEEREEPYVELEGEC